MMRRLVLNAVVGRIANFPFGGVVLGSCVLCRKAFSSLKKDAT